MDFDKLVSAFGWPGAILVVISIFGWRISARVMDELFSRELDKDGNAKGYALSFLNEQRIFLRAAIASIAQNSDHLKRSDDAMKSMAESASRTADAIAAIGEDLEKIKLGSVCRASTGQADHATLAVEADGGGHVHPVIMVPAHQNG